MPEETFDPAKLDRLNNPDRLLDIPPDVVWKQVKREDPEVFVDIGAGTGFFSIQFLRYLKNGIIYACDTSETMIQWMQTHVVPEFPAIVPLQMDGPVVPLKDDIADLVFMITLHHELDAPESILEEARRIVKPAGAVAIVDWKPEAGPTGPPGPKRCRPDQVKAQLFKAGFQNVQSGEDLPKHFLVSAVK